MMAGMKTWRRSKVWKTTKPRTAEKAQRVLAFVRDFKAERGYLPSVRQIAAGVGISSTSMVSYYLNILERDGLIAREYQQPRTISLALGRRAR